MRLTRRSIGLAGLAVLLPVRARAAVDLAPGGGRDITGQLQAAIDRAARERRPLQLGAGDYRVAGLTLPDGADLIGQGRTTRIVATGAGPVVELSSVGSARVRDLAISGEGRASQGLSARDVGSLDLENVAVDAVTEACLRLERSGGRIARCRLTGSVGSGIFVLDGDAVAILDNDVSGCGNGGILVWRSAPGHDGARISGNRIAAISARDGGTGQNGNGINLYRADDVAVSGNSLTGCAFSAIRANTSSNVVISGNRALGSGETAIYVEFASSGAVIAGNLVDGAVNGITVTNFNEGGRLAAVSGNVVRNLSGKPVYAETSEGFGLGISVEADTAVTGNVVEGAAVGLRIGFGAYSRDVAASGNVIRAARIGIGVSVSAGAGAVVLGDNVISGAKSGAIVGFDGDRAATGDLAIAGAERFRNLTLSGNRVVP